MGNFGLSRERVVSSLLGQPILRLVPSWARVPTWSGTSFLLCLVGFRPRFHSVWSHPLCNCLVKNINQGTDKHKTELPASSYIALCVLKHPGTRLIILTGGNNNHKIKIVESGQSAVGSRHPPPFDCKYTFLSLPKILIACMRRGGGV